MRKFEFHTLDVFTTHIFGGNPLAVFPYAAGLSDHDMQAIAAEINYSETTFVLPPRDQNHTAHVRIFTPMQELPFAGHPNVGTGYLLARHPHMMPTTRDTAELIFEETAGLVRIVPQCDKSGCIIGSSITAPEPFSQHSTLPAHVIADCVGLGERDIQTNRTAPIVGGTGLRFAIAEVTSRDALRAATPSIADFTTANTAHSYGEDSHSYGGDSHSYGGDSFSVLLFFVDGDGVIHTRMFAPLGGILEDPATGSAATALAGLLAKLDPATDDTIHFNIQQGVDMGRPSQIHVAVRKANGIPQAPVLSGSCVEVISGTFRL